jgi:hypothetical protein
MSLFSNHSHPFSSFRPHLPSLDATISSLFKAIPDATDELSEAPVFSSNKATYVAKEQKAAKAGHTQPANSRRHNSNVRTIERLESAQSGQSEWPSDAREVKVQTSIQTSL